MKQVFPEIRPRRLGTRGHSRYCYAALRKTTKLLPPVLPTLGEAPTTADRSVPSSSSGGEHVDDQSSDVIRKWATNLLNVDFANAKDLADYITANQLQLASNSNRLRMNQKKSIAKETAGGSSSSVVATASVSSAVPSAVPDTLAGASPMAAIRCPKKINVSINRECNSFLRKNSFPPMGFVSPKIFGRS